MRLSALFIAGCLTFAAADSGQEWEKLPDGSTGQVMELHAADGVPIAAYVRKPDGAGPFPVVVLLHGGAASKEATFGLGRTTNPPTGDLVAAGWAVFAVDFRPNPAGMMDPRERDDTMSAIAKVRGLPFIDGERLALLGGSHGANLIARLASRVDARCAVLCAPAALDLPLIAKAADRGQEIVPILKKLIADMEQKYGAKAAGIARNRKAYGYESAYTEASKVRFPLLFINGRNDTSSPIPVVEAYSIRVRLGGKMVESYFPENGPHGFYFGHPSIPETGEAARRAVAFIRLHFGQGKGPVPDDAVRLSQIMARQQRRQSLTAEERHFAEQMQARRFAEYAREHPPRESTGLIPLNDLGKGMYKGEQGGLYPGGGNVPPAAHAEAGQAAAGRIVPLDADGKPSAGGKIVLMTAGMSNTTMESQAFLKLAKGDSELNPRLVLVDGAQGGRTAMVTADPEAEYWNIDDQRLQAAGVTPKQVQAVWLKQANAQPAAPFPTEAKTLKWNLVDTLQNLKDRYPNLQIAYLSSRIYAGYATTGLNPEPHAYEGAFSVKWVIADQMAGSPELNCDSGRGAVRAPWVAWGPYLWTDGLKGRSDGLVWLREDVGPDGTHPSPSGTEKVAKLLLDFLKKDPTSRPWFVR